MDFSTLVCTIFLLDICVLRTTPSTTTANNERRRTTNDDGNDDEPSWEHGRSMKWNKKEKKKKQQIGIIFERNIDRTSNVRKIKIYSFSFRCTILLQPNACKSQRRFNLLHFCCCMEFSYAHCIAIALRCAALVGVDWVMCHGLSLWFCLLSEEQQKTHKEKAMLNGWTNLSTRLYDISVPHSRKKKCFIFSIKFKETINELCLREKRSQMCSMTSNSISFSLRLLLNRFSFVMRSLCLSWEWKQHTKCITICVHVRRVYWMPSICVFVCILILPSPSRTKHRHNDSTQTCNLIYNHIPTNIILFSCIY